MPTMYRILAEDTWQGVKVAGAAPKATCPELVVTRTEAGVFVGITKLAGPANRLYYDALRGDRVSTPTTSSAATPMPVNPGRWQRSWWNRSSAHVASRTWCTPIAARS